MPHAPRPVHHVVVVGLMGVGKSTVGRRLAARLGWSWRDSDRDIETATGSTVRALSERDGVDAMHAVEARVLLDALQEPGHSVISAAASTIEVPVCRAAMAAPGVAVVWLRAPAEVLASRFAARDRHRPEFGPSPLDVLTEQALRREPMFASLDPIVVDVAQVRPKEAAERAVRLIRALG